jgi:hypothetical protein
MISRRVKQLDMAVMLIEGQKMEDRRAIVESASEAVQKGTSLSLIRSSVSDSPARLPFTLLPLANRDYKIQQNLV